MGVSQIWINGEWVRLYSAREAADYCGGPEGSVHIATIRRWRETGWLRKIELNPKSYMYTKEMLDECLELKGYKNRIIK